MEKPLECSDCQKCAIVIYTQVIGESKTTVQMCRDCPILKEKVKGKLSQKERVKKRDLLYCTHCSTSLDSILMGGGLGCKDCYDIFEECLIRELLETRQLSRRLKLNPTDSFPPLHSGKSPFKSQRAEKSAHIRELKKALSEAIKGEHYEEAAWLRDQMNSLIQASEDDS